MSKAGETCQVDRKVELTEEEKVLIGDALAKDEMEWESTNDDRKETAKHYKEELDRIRSRITEASGLLSRGFRVEEVECFVEKDHEARERIYRSCETGEEVRRSAFLPGDEQSELQM